MRIVDAHQHLIYPERFMYGWCRGIPALEGKRLGLEEYRVAAQSTGISQTVFMEVDVDEPDMKAEADFFLQLASEPANEIAGVVAACRPEREDFPALVESMLHPRLKGLRRVLHTQPDEVAKTRLFGENLARLARHRLTFDLCVLPRQLPMGVELARRAPDVQFILDHCGVPNVKAGELDPWRECIRELARLPNVACKVSGLVAYCEPQRVTAKAIRPFFEHCLECFGWERVLFGGDWPVCNLTATLARWLDIARELVGGEPVERQEQFFAVNAERIYRLTG